MCISVDQGRTYILRIKYSRRRPVILTGYRGFRQFLGAHSEPVSQTRPRSSLPHSSVNILTSYGPDDSDSIPSRDRDVLFTTATRAPLGTFHLSKQIGLH
jgi:hypothetical protein